jgi:hypothetical protein
VFQLLDYKPLKHLISTQLKKIIESKFVNLNDEARSPANIRVMPGARQELLYFTFRNFFVIKNGVDLILPAPFNVILKVLYSQLLVEL